MFTLISYLWILFMLAVLITPIVIGLMNKPKKAKSAATEPSLEGMGAPEEQQVLDFGDELAQMDSK
ncbi:MAG: hypothetical protein MUF23_11085 [Pirellula sp.]|jgi:hypothetical protein|nr:hypothetical protein [Pirellula sp.]